MQDSIKTVQLEGILWVQRLSSPDCRVWTEGEIRNSKVLRRREKEAVIYIAKENYDEKAPLQKNLATILHLNHAEMTLPNVKSEHIGGSATISEIVVARHLDRLPIKAGRLYFPEDFSWLDRYSREYRGSLCNDPLEDLKHYNPRGQGMVHWTVSVQLDGRDKPCFYSLNLQKPLPPLPLLSYACQNSQ